MIPQIVEHESRHVRILNLLARVAADIPNPHKTRIAAAIVFRGEVISLGVNQKKTHPFQARYSKNPDSVYLHAETAAIKNALKYLKPDQLTECSLYVCRVKFFDTSKKRMLFGIAKPCAGCMKCMKRFGIKEIIYSLDGDDYSVGGFAAIDLLDFSHVDC